MAAVFAFAAQAFESVLAIDRRNTATFDFVVAAIQQLAHLDKLREVSGHGILDEFIRRSAGGRGKFLEAGFGFRLEVHDHGIQFRDAVRKCQNDCDRVVWARAKRR